MKFIDSCFQSLLKTDYPNVEWIVVDNASSDESPRLIREKFPQFKMIQSERNLGYTGGNNIGIQSSQGKYVVLVNNDVEVEPDWLSHLVSTAESDAAIGALQPKLQSMINKGYFEYAGASGGFIDIWGYPFLRGRIFDTIEDDHGQYDDEREVFWASGAAMFLRRSALDEAGLLDDVFFMHFEEIDLCWRMHLLGYAVKVVPKSKIYHYVGASLPAQSVNKMYWNHRNSIIALIKNVRGSRIWKVLLVRFLLDGIAAVRGLWSEPQRVWAILNAHLWIYFHTGLLLQKRRKIQSTAKTTEDSFQHVIYPKSIVRDYFLKKKLKFHTLKF